MKIISDAIYLAAKFFNAVKIGNNYIEVFTNPSTSEIRELKKTTGNIRLIIDNKTKTIYAWDGFLATHSKIIQALKLNISYNHTVLGAAIIHNSKLVFSGLSSTEETPAITSKLMKINWAWAEKYVAKLAKGLKKEHQRLQ